MENVQLDLRIEHAWNERMLNLQNAYIESLKILEESELINYQRGIAESCKILGYCFWRFSDFSLSMSHSLRAIKIFQNLGDKKGEADTLNNIGAVYMFQNDHEKRLEVNKKCKELREQIGDFEGVTSSEGNIGETYFEMNDFVNAKICFENVLSHPDSSDQGKAWAYHNLGLLGNAEERYQDALNNYNKGLELSKSVNYAVLITESYIKITELYIELDEYKKAIESAEKALNVSREIGAKDGEKRALYCLSKIYELTGEFKSSLLYHKNFHVLDLEISRDREIERLKTTQLKVAYEKIEEQRNELVNSIKYAEQIQNAALERNQNQELLNNFFTFYKPKDIVSGDFYWYFERNHVYYFGVADCTGHGVPGAILTMLGITYLNEIVAVNDTISPANLLDELRERIISGLSQSTFGGNKDGMDISVIRVDTQTNAAQWAGANHPLIIIKNEETGENESSLTEIKGDKQPISIAYEMYPFTNHEFSLSNKDRLYFFTDGFVDQFGGEKGKKLMKNNFRNKLIELQNLELKDQKNELQTFFESWKKDLEQVDDVCVVGIEY